MAESANCDGGLGFLADEFRPTVTPLAATAKAA